MRCPLVTLGDCCEIVSGATPSTTNKEYWDGRIFWATPKDLSALEGHFISDTPRKLTESGLASCAATILPPNSVLFSSRAPIGHVAINTVPMATNQGFKSFVPKPDQIDAKFLFHWLRANRSYLESLGVGATFKEVSKTIVSRVEIPLPSLSEQRHIATILDKADALRALRRVAIAKLDELLQSVFIEMFGDPVTNPKGWAIGSLSAHGSFKNGLNFGKGESGVTVRYVGVGDFRSKAALEDFSSLAFIELNDLPAEDYFLHDGDLLFVRSNGNRELVGRCMVVYPGMEKVTYSGFCIRYRITDVSLQSTYVAHLFRSVPFRRLIFQGGQGANIQNINQQVLSGLPIPIPDEGLQTQFTSIVKKIEAQKRTMQRASEKSDAFFASLQQLAFSGKL